MNRYRRYGGLDDVPEPVGDGGFARLDMRTDPATLPAGTVQVSENFRFDTAGARVRAGIANQFRPNDSTDTILWAAVYRPEGSNDRLALVTGSALFLFNPADQSLTEVAYAGGATIAEGAPVDFIQGGISSGTTPDAYILRGLALEALQYNGATVAAAPDFRKGLFGVFDNDRMIVAGGDASASTSQEAHVSDFLDFTTWTLLNQFKVLYGSDDYLVSFLPYQKDYVIVATRKRFFIAHIGSGFSTSGAAGGISVTDSFFRQLTREAGLVGRRAWLEAAGKIWFVTDRAIYAFTPQLDNELTVLGEPLSAAIQPIMDRLSANYASGADAKHLGYRIYFALPINGEALAIEAAAVVNGTPNVATVTTAAGHGLQEGDTVQVTGTQDDGLNGIKTVLTVPSATTFTFETTASEGATVGTRGSVQYVATRNNRIAVFNLMTGGWESVDVLPTGLFADFLLVADHGAQRRLWLVDRVVGVALYEEGEVDEVNSLNPGSLTLPFTLPALFSTSNFASVPIAGRLRSRVYRWGAWPRQVKASEVRLTLGPEDAGNTTTTVSSPDRDDLEVDREFTYAGRGDVSARKRLGRRGLEAEVEVTASMGRPTVRQITVETVPAGRVAEEG